MRFHFPVIIIDEDFRSENTSGLGIRALADAGKSVRYLAGRAVWQASGTYRGGEAKTDAKDAASDRRSIADARHRSAGSAHPR